MGDETKLEYIIRAKAEMRAELRAKSWPEKVRAIERMNEFSSKAKKAMQETLRAKEAADKSQPSERVSG